MAAMQKVAQKLFARFLEDERALVVSWFDIIVLLCFTMLVFMMLGPLVDQLYIYMHQAPMNITMGEQSVAFYTDTDRSTLDDLYDLYQWIPYMAAGVIIYYAINYSNFKRGSE